MTATITMLSVSLRIRRCALKIDQSFIALIEDGTEKTAIIQAIITLAHALGMDVVAEGVETSVQHDLLVAMHCEYGQGYLFAQPLLPERAASIIEQHITWG